VLHELSTNLSLAVAGLQAMSVPRCRKDLAAGRACRLNEKQATLAPGGRYKLHSISIPSLHLFNYNAFLSFFTVCESAMYWGPRNDAC